MPKIEIPPPKPPSPEPGGNLESGSSATTANKVIEIKRLKRKKEAEKLKKAKQEKNPNPRKDGEPKPKAEAIQEKYEEALVDKGEALTPQEKLNIIKSEALDPKAAALTRTCDELNAAIAKLPNQASRIDIEAIIHTIPDTVYADPDLADIAREIKQQAYNQIMREPAYMSGIDIEKRIDTGKLFKDAKLTRVYEDEAYLRAVGESVLPKEVTKANVEVEKQVAVDLVKRLNEKNNLDEVDAIIKTIHSPQMLDTETALRKIEHGPDWVKNVKDSALDNPYALSMLADLSDAHVMNPDFIKDPAHSEPAYLYMKGVQLRIQNEELYGSGNTLDTKTLFSANGVRDAIKDQVKMAVEGKQLFTDTDYSFYMDVSQEAVKEAHGAGPTPAGGTTTDEFWDASEKGALNDSIPEEKKIIDALIELDARVKRVGLDNSAEDVFEVGNLIFKPDYLKIAEHNIPHTAEKIFQKYKELREAYRERYLAYSNISFEREQQVVVYANLGHYLRNTHDRILAQRELFPTKFQEGIESNTRLAQGFIEQPDFYNKVKEFWDNQPNWGKINEHYDYQITDETTLHNHPYYKLAVESREKWDTYYDSVRAEFNTLDLLVNLDTSFQAQGLEGAAKSSIAFTAHNAIIIRNGRVGFNDEVYTTFNRNGMNAKFVGQENKIQLVWGGVKKSIWQETEQELLDNKAKYLPQLQAFYGKDVDYELMVKGAMQEAYMLLEMDGRPARWMGAGLTITDGEKQFDAPIAWGVTVGTDDALLAAEDPVMWREARWGMMTEVSWHVVEKGTTGDAERLGTFKDLQGYLDTMDLTTPDGRERFLKYKEHLFRVQVLRTDPKRKEIEKRQLNFFHRNEDGSWNFFAPAKLDKVTKAQTLRYAAFRETFDTVSDRELGSGYLHAEASYIRDPIQQVLEIRHGDRKDVALHERVCSSIGHIYDFEHGDHEDVHHEIEKLVKLADNPKDEGDIALLTRYEPLSAHDALASTGYIEADEFFDRNAASYNIFHGLRETAAITAGRKDLLYKRWFKRHEHIKRDFAHDTGRTEAIDFRKVDLSDPVDKPKFGLTDRQYEVGLKNCTDLEEFKGWLKIGKDFSDWTRKDHQIHALGQPIHASYWRVIHIDDPEYVRLDVLPHIAKKLGIQATDDFSLRIINNPRNTGKGNDYNRMFNDCWNVEKAADPLHKALRILSLKDVEQNLELYSDTTELTSGLAINQKNKMFLRGGIAATIHLDKAKEAMLQTGQHPFVASSDHQRLTNKAGIALDSNKTEIFWEQAGIRGGTNIEAKFRAMTHAYELQMEIIVGKLNIVPKWLKNTGEFISDHMKNGVINKIVRKISRAQIDVGTYRWPKPLRDFGRFVNEKTGWNGLDKLFSKSFSIKYAWVPRVIALLLLIGAGTGVAMGKNIQQGFAGGSGGGGGAPAHEHG